MVDSVKDRRVPGESRYVEAIFGGGRGVKGHSGVVNGMVNRGSGAVRKGKLSLCFPCPPFVPLVLWEGR